MLYDGILKKTSVNVSFVLILIFLENALRQNKTMSKDNKLSLGLNPYFFGKCSTTKIGKLSIVQHGWVLILIFLENALRRLKTR